LCTQHRSGAHRRALSIARGLVVVHSASLGGSSSCTQHRSGTCHRALAVVYSVCIDHDRVNTTPDKAKFLYVNSRFLFLLLPHPILGGCAHARYKYRFAASTSVHRIDYTFALSTPARRAEYKPPPCWLRSTMLSTSPSITNSLKCDYSPSGATP
jgi:hypothetical protein